MPFKQLKAEQGRPWGSAAWERVAPMLAPVHEHLVRALEARPLVAAWISPLWGQVHGPLQPLYTELLDWNDPPMFKNFLRLDASDTEMSITCFAATGCLEQELEPPIEDLVRAVRDADGRWNWQDPNTIQTKE